MLNLSEIQGNIVPGFKKDHQRFLLIKFCDDPAKARQWLSELRPEIASGGEVLAFNRLFKSIVERRKRDGWRRDRSSYEENRDYGALSTVSSTWVNVAFTWQGLRRLCGGDLDRLPAELFGSRLGGIAAPDDEDAAHALLLVAADWETDLEAKYEEHARRLRTYDLKLVDEFRGHSLPDAREHFGYRDGISQPALEGIDDNGPYLPPGDFILGYPTTKSGSRPRVLPRWASNGSFLVFLQLQQDVGAFDAARSANVQAAQMHDAAQVGAALVGRWPSGSPAGSQLDDIRRTQKDPGWNGGVQSTDRFPAFSHVGRANPRDRNVELNYRLIRRGIPYGTPLSNRMTDNSSRGLLFLSYQADIAEQFEGVWFDYLQDPNFPARGAGADPLTGQVATGESHRELVIPDEADKGERIELKLGQFVSLQFGQYLFAPSLSALKQLSEGAMTINANDLEQIRQVLEQEIRRHETNRHDRYGPGLIDGPSQPGPNSGLDQNTKPGIPLIAAVLGDTLLTQNPYTSSQLILRDYVGISGPAAANYNTNTYQMGPVLPGQNDPREYWYIGSERLAITKTIKIPYSYTDANGAQHQASIVIGFNGPPMP